MKDLVTIVTVCYNASDLIEETIKSVVSQNYPNKEYIIIDGGSTDGTIDIIKKYGSKIDCWISEKDCGIYDAMNKGILRSSGKWINFMNAGDTFYSANAIDSFINSVEENSIIVYGDTLLVYDLGERLKKPDDLARLKKEMVFGHQSSFIRTDYHKRNLFDISFRSSGDFKFFHDSYYKGVKFQYIPITIARYLARGGFSNTHWQLVAQENARIYGIDGTLKWNFIFFQMKIKAKLIELVKKLFPVSFIIMIRTYLVKRVGTDAKS